MRNISRFFCEHCKKETHFLPIHRALLVAGVSRSTIYYWIDKDWIHWRELPSGRRVICEGALSQQGSASPASDAKGISA